jgi:hypothetical protein
VGGVVVIEDVGGAAGEAHDATKLVAMAARRGVVADEGFEQAGDLALECADCVGGLRLLSLGGAIFPAEGEAVDEHADSVITLALEWGVTQREHIYMSKTQSAMVELGTVAPAFELMDVVTGKAVGRDDVATGMKGLLVMFLCVHCPYVKHVEEELARIGVDYAGKIGIVAISSNDVVAYPQDAPEGMKAQAERLGFRFPYLFDETQEVARKYDAACTPDIFLFDVEMKLVYRGQLDDSRPKRPSGGGNDVPVTGKDLRKAMDDVLAGRRPDPNQRFSVGCNIKWKE